MTTYLTTAEVANLKGCSLQYVQKCIKEGKIKASLRETAANNRTEYCVLLTDLPEKMQIKWENKKRSELGLDPVPLPCKSAPKPDPRQITLQDLTGDQRDNVGFWCEILQEWQRVRSSRGDNLGKCKVDELYCATIKLKYPNISISPDILYRKAILKCKSCRYCVGGGRGSARGRYYCEHPVAAKSACASAKLICYVPRRSEEFTIKRTPKWCPLEMR